MKVKEPLYFAEGTRTYPGGFRALEGVQDPSGRRRAPFGARYANGATVKAFYDHHYREPNEHYHASLEDLRECRA